MHSNHLSATETAVHFRLSSASVVLNWERVYYEEGVQGLYLERRGKTKNMKSKPARKSNIKIKEDLITENRCLRMENEYKKTKEKITSIFYNLKGRHRYRRVNSRIKE